MEKKKVNEHAAICRLGRAVNLARLPPKLRLHTDVYQFYPFFLHP